MLLKDQLFTFIEQKLKGKYDLLALNISQDTRSRTRLQMIIDRLDNESITHDDCVDATRSVKEGLAQKIEEDYILEVSSPGLDRPLNKPEHFIRFIGHSIRFKVDGNKKSGIIKSANNETFELESGENISYQSIKDAKLHQNKETKK